MEEETKDEYQDRLAAPSRISMSNVALQIPLFVKIYETLVSEEEKKSHIKTNLLMNCPSSSLGRFITM